MTETLNRTDKEKKMQKKSFYLFFILYLRKCSC